MAQLASRKILESGVGWHIRSGNQAIFWEDKWLFKEPLIKTKRFNRWVELCKVAFRELVKDYWYEGEWVNLCVIIQELAQLQSSLKADSMGQNQEDDILVWMENPSGNYSISSTISLLSLSQAPPPFWSKERIKHLTPKVNIFFWIMLQNKVLMVDNLCKWGFQISNRCYLCKSEAESANHLFLHCSFVSLIWVKLLALWNISWVFPRPLKSSFYNGKSLLKIPSFKGYGISYSLLLFGECGKHKIIDISGTRRCQRIMSLRKNLGL